METSASRCRIATAFVVVLALSSARSNAAPCLYVGSADTDTVSVVDLSLAQVTRTIVVGRAPVALVADKNAQLLYAANRLEDTVSVIDTKRLDVIDTYPVGRLPSALELSPNGAELYVANGFFEGQVGNAIAVIDTETGETADVIPEVFDPSTLELSPDGQSLYIGGLALREVLILDTAFRAISGQLDISGSSSDLVINIDGTRLYVAGTGVNQRTVTAIDIESMEIAAETPVADAAFVALSRDELDLFVSGFGSEVSVLDARDLTHIGAVRVSGVAAILRSSPDGALLAVALLDRDAISLVNPATKEEVKVVPLNGTPSDVAFGDCELPCPGDCNGDKTVSIVELIRVVRIALNEETIAGCLRVDTNADARVSVDELVRAVDSALTGCI